MVLFEQSYKNCWATTESSWKVYQKFLRTVYPMPNTIIYTSISFSFWRPGNYTLFLFAEDGYEVLASYQIQVLDWAQCLPEDCKWLLITL
jgi:hypothetical protein